MKKFNEFNLNEASLGDALGNDKLREMDREETQRLGVSKDDPRQAMQYGPRLMGLLGESQRMTRGKETEIEELAKNVIHNYYGSLLDDVELDISLSSGPNDVKNFMDENSNNNNNNGNSDENGDDNNNPPNLEEEPVDNELLQKEIQKRKIINNVTQGEAKNTKRMLAMPEIIDGLEKIFGNRNTAERLKDIWLEMTTLADKMDWVIPIEHKAMQMENAPQGLAGACAVNWKESGESDEIRMPDNQEELEDNEEYREELEESFSNGTPEIKSIGVDLPMLLHETVKGIYELIAASGIPEDERIATSVIINTSSFADEAEEFRYGPVIASRLRDFLNECERVDAVENMREMVFGKMVLLQPDTFIDLMKRILSNDQSAKRDLQEMIDQTIQEDEEYRRDLYDFEEESYDEDDEDENIGIDDLISSDDDVEEDDLETQMQRAIENEDYEEAARLRDLMTNESRRIKRFGE